MPNSSNTQKMIRGISSQAFVTVANGVVEIICFSILSRLLSKQDFGYFAALQAVTVVFASISETGIGASVVQKKELTKKYINNAFSLSVLLGVLLSLAMILFSSPISVIVADESMKKPLLLMSSTLLFNSVASVNLSLMQRELQFLKIGIVNLVSLIVTSVLAVYFAWRGWGYYAIISKVILSSFLTLIISSLCVKEKYSLRFDKNEMKSIWDFTSWLMASALLRNVSQQIDKLMMSRLLSIEALGSYNRPKDFVSNIASRLNGIFDTALFPVLSGVQDDYKSMKNALKKSLSLLNMFGALVSIGFIINAELIVRLFFGTKWLELVPLFRIMSLYFLLNVDGRLMDCFLRSLAQTKSQFYFRLMQLLVTIIAMIIGARGGMIGIGVGIICVYLVMDMIKLWSVARHIDVAVVTCLKDILYSFRFLIAVIPISLLAMFITPSTVIGNVILLGIFIISVIVVFVLMPVFVGGEYADLVYPKVKGVLSKLLKW